MNLGNNVEHDKPKETDGREPVRITLNGLGFHVAAVITGAVLRGLPTPPVDADYDLFRVDPGGTDLLVRDREVIEVEEGDAFISVPRLILPGSRTDETRLG
jgi:hypothetical protein